MRDELRSQRPMLRSNEVINLFTHALVGFGILRGSDFIVDIANNKLLEIWGKTAADIMNKAVFEAVPEMRDQGYENHLAEVLNKGQRLILPELPMRLTREGRPELIYVKAMYEPMFDEDGSVSGVMMLIDDISAEVLARNASSTHATVPDISSPKTQVEQIHTISSKGTEDLEAKIEALQRSEERYHKMVEEVQDYAIILLDENGVIQNWNKGAKKIKQYHASEVIGRHFRLFYLQEDRDTGLPDKLLNIARLEGRAVHEGWRLRKDHTKFWGSISLTAIHNEKNEVIGFSKVSRDLTEKKMADDQLAIFARELTQKNDALKKSEQQYHRMIAEVEDYAIILLNEKGEIQNWNAGAEKIKGYKSQEIVGKNFRVFYTAKDQEEKLPEMLLNHSIAHGKAVHEGWRVRKDGTHFWGSIVLTALHNSEGAIIGFSKVTRDLSERKLAEDKMHDYLNELEKQNKALEQFAYVASHDLQEPLRKIQTFAEIIEHNIGNDSVLQKYIVKINASGKRMSDLIRSVLNYSRLSDNTRELVDVDLNTLVASVITDYELKIEEINATISCEALPSVKGIPLQLNQLFANLIGNALKFTDKKPVIRISSHVRSGDEIKDLPFGHNASTYLEVIVTDNGIGFDQQYEKLIFTMFQRLHGKHEYSGTGIGLALCKRIMENHNGFIKATGELSKGASFSLYFPIDKL